MHLPALQGAGCQMIRVDLLHEPINRRELEQVLEPRATYQARPGHEAEPVSSAIMATQQQLATETTIMNSQSSQI